MCQIFLANSILKISIFVVGQEKLLFFPCPSFHCGSLIWLFWPPWSSLAILLNMSNGLSPREWLFGALLCFSQLLPQPWSRCFYSRSYVVSWSGHPCSFYTCAISSFRVDKGTCFLIQFNSLQEMAWMPKCQQMGGLLARLFWIWTKKVKITFLTHILLKISSRFCRVCFFWYD